VLHAALEDDRVAAAAWREGLRPAWYQSGDEPRHLQVQSGSLRRERQGRPFPRPLRFLDKRPQPLLRCRRRESPGYAAGTEEFETRREASMTKGVGGQDVSNRLNNMRVLGQDIKTSGKLIRIVRFDADGYEPLEDPATAIDALRKSDASADIFTFTQMLPETT